MRDLPCSYSSSSQINPSPVDPSTSFFAQCVLPCLYCCFSFSAVGGLDGDALNYRCRIEEAIQAVKNVDAKAFRQALPKQLKLCGELLSELATHPGGESFERQWVRLYFHSVNATCRDVNASWRRP